MTSILSGTARPAVGFQLAGGLIGGAGAIGLVSVFVLGRTRDPF